MNKSQLALQGQLKLLHQGEPTGGIPLGYVRSTTRIMAYQSGIKRVRTVYRRPLEVDEEEAKMVINIFEIYASGLHSIKSIRNILKDKYGFDMTASNINDLLSNRFYIGEMFHRSLGVFPHTYPTFINRELFDLVQKVKSSAHRHKRTHSSSSLKRIYLFSSLLKCKICGDSVTHSMAKKKYVYINCIGYKSNHPKKIATETKLLEQINLLLHKIPKNIINPYAGEDSFRDLIIQFIILAYFIWNNTQDTNKKRMMLKIFFKEMLLEDRTLHLVVNKPFDTIFERSNIENINNDMERDFNLESLRTALRYLNGDHSEDVIIKEYNYKKVTAEQKAEILQDGSLSSKILSICLQGRSTNDIILLTKESLTDVQIQLLDLQMDGKIDQDNSGLWITQ